MKVIQLTENCYVQPQAILILQAELGLASKAPASVQAEWDARPDKSSGRFFNSLLPAIKAVLVEQREVFLYFATDEARDSRLAELVKEWKAE